MLCIIMTITLLQDPVMAVNMIEGLLDQYPPLEPALLIYLLGTALNNYNTSEAVDEFVEVCNIMRVAN